MQNNGQSIYLFTFITYDILHIYSRTALISFPSPVMAAEGAREGEAGEKQTTDIPFFFFSLLFLFL